MSWTEAMGINHRNAWANLFDYSRLAMTAVDLAASAPGKIDVEAARYLRLAHGMIRSRVDLLIDQAKNGPRKLINGQETCIQVSARPFAAFCGIEPLCSADTAKLARPDDSTLPDLEKVASHARQAFDGNMLDGLDRVIRAEVAFHRAEPDEILSTIGDAQAEMLEGLMGAAATIADLAIHAAHLLRDKLSDPRALHVCTSCGALFYGVPEKCNVCEAPASLVIAYPCEPGPLIKARDRDFFEKTGPR